MDVMDVPQDQRDTIAAWLTERAAALLSRAQDDRDMGANYQAVGQEAAAAELRAMALALKGGNSSSGPELVRSTTLDIDAGDDYTLKLKEKMAQKNILPSELAREMGVNQSQVSRWFNTTRGKMQPRRESRVSIEQAIAAILRKRARNMKGGGGGVHKVGSGLNINNEETAILEGVGEEA